MLSDQGYRSFVRENCDSLFRYAYHFVKNRMDAEDVLQETLMKLWNVRKEISPDANPRAYAFRMLKNKCLDRLRKAHRNPTQAVSDLPEQESDGPVADISEKQVRINHVMKIIQRLPESQREIVLLRNIEGYSIKEIAEIMHMKVNTVEVTLSRGRRKIRAEYEKRMKNYEN